MPFKDPEAHKRYQKKYQKRYQSRYQAARSRRLREAEIPIEPAMTFEEIGKVLGLSRTFVGRIYATAIYKMRLAAGMIS